MDFGKMLSQQGQEAPIEPRELWGSLPDKAKGYGYLRDVQGQVLAAWHERRGERDLVVKVNTGGGKTIAGLVILTSYLNAGEGPALYVAPDKYLADQVCEEARQLGIPTVDDPDSPRYLSGEAIAVVNAHKLVNGRSVFAGTRPNGAPAPIGSVVIDDVHAAVAITRSQLSLTIDRNDGLFDEMLDLFRRDLEGQSPTDLLDVVDHGHGALLRVPFWSWRAKIDRTRALLHKHRNTESLTYTWPAVKDVLLLCRAVFTATTLTITPPCPPIRHITGFADARHRVYLTATLADDGVLVTDFDADPASVRSPITPFTAGDIGERMILAPQEINPDLADDEVRGQIAALASRHNVVVLVPSDRAAAKWTRWAPTIVHAPDVGPTVTRLRAGPVGLVVLVNKYDGIDLPDDACRVLVLDGLPEVATGDERLEGQLLRQAGVNDRQVQRIEQGMGRGVRSNEDHCVVFLLGARLGQLVADPRSLVRFSPATRAQLELSRTVAGEMSGAEMPDIMRVAAQALDRDPSWIRFAKSQLASIPAAHGIVTDDAVARRRAFERATDNDFRGAAQLISDATSGVPDGRAVGWLLEQKATYLDLIDPQSAQEVLAVARGKNASVLRPLSGVTYQRISASNDQAQRASDFLSRTYDSPALLRLGIESIVDDLVFDPDRVEDFEEAMWAAGAHLGFTVQRPEKELGSGPDVLWALGDLKYWVIEAKSGSTSNVIHKRDANQLAGSMLWFRERYDSTVTATPVMVHKARQMASDATATEGLRVLMEDNLGRLSAELSSYAAGLASSRWDTAQAVNGQLLGHHLRTGDLLGYLRPTQSAVAGRG